MRFAASKAKKSRAGDGRFVFIGDLMATNLFDLTEEVAVVIGATGVLGGSMAAALAAAGARVVVAGRNAQRGQARANELLRAGGRAVFVETDATERDSVEQLLASTAQSFGIPSILVNAAGGNDPRVTVTPEHSFSDITTDDWMANYDLNLVGGALVPCQVIGQAMVDAGRGSVINIASTSGHLPLSRVVAYSAAKAAVLNLTQFLAREWAQSGVRVNSISPGFFPAEQNLRLLFNPDGTTTPRAAAILSHTPMARFGEAEELAGAVVFLASPQASSFVTGSDIRVDGGFLSQTI
jgi:NAD(P)-dependent dehydrogenase (short-subunit alcohol dehydrogenase family)